jgi:probable rRNA maturation factor
MIPQEWGRTGRRPRRGAPALRVEVGDERGRREGIAPGLGRWLVHVAPTKARGTVSIALVGDALIRRLNRRYRGRDAVTDVLSFSAGPTESAPGRFLGDIVIARGVAQRQARRAGHSTTMEVRLLALHGLLHLLGYDHERDDGRMSRLETRLRRKGGLREGRRAGER